MKKRLNILLCVAAAAMLLVSCSEAAVDVADGTNSGESVRFDFIIDEQWQGTTLSDGTRAIVDDAASSAISQIANMIVMQYDVDGGVARYDYFPTFDAMPSININDATTTIVFIANTFDDGVIITSATTLSDLQAKTTAIAAHNDVLQSDGGGGDQYIVMSGTVDYATTQETSATLRRNCARLDITVDNQISSDWTLSNIETLNVPTASYLYTDYDLPDTFPASESFTTTDITWSQTELTYATTSAARIYIPANKRGTDDSSTESMLRPLYAPDGATALRLTLASAADNGANERTYTFYLGENTTDNFNILPNFAYTYTFTISHTGNSTTDPRIEVTKTDGVLPQVE